MTDNYRLPIQKLAQLGLLSLTSFWRELTMTKSVAACLIRGTVWRGRPERESRTPVNIAN